MAENRAIGKDNRLLWHISEDLKHFKRTTLGKPIIMGRKSYESIGKPLPGRANIVISRTFESLPEGEATAVYKDLESSAIETEAPSPTSLHYAKSIEDSIKLGKEIATTNGIDEIFITGGGEIYRQTMSLIDRLYLTMVHQEYEGDTFFPEFDWDAFTVLHKERHEAEGEQPAFTFFTLERK